MNKRRAFTAKLKHEAVQLVIDVQQCPPRVARSSGPGGRLWNPGIPNLPLDTFTGAYGE
jgi:hypothetical protein